MFGKKGETTDLSDISIPAKNSHKKSKEALIN